MSVPSHTIKAVLSEYAPDMYGITGPVCLSIWHLISMGTGRGVQVLSLLSVQGLVTQLWVGGMLKFQAMSLLEPSYIV